MEIGRADVGASRNESNSTSTWESESHGMLTIFAGCSAGEFRPETMSGIMSAKRGKTRNHVHYLSLVVACEQAEAEVVQGYLYTNTRFVRRYMLNIQVAVILTMGSVMILL